MIAWKYSIEGLSLISAENSARLICWKALARYSTGSPLKVKTSDKAIFDVVILLKGPDIDPLELQMEPLSEGGDHTHGAAVCPKL